MNTLDAKIEKYLTGQTEWREAMERLRSIALDCGLVEELRWGKPCYQFNGANVAIIQGFKDKCAFMFFKGGLLKDPDELLKRPGKNSHVGRRLEFSTVDEVVQVEDCVRSFISEAIAAEEAGLEVEVPPNPEPPPEELIEIFGEIAGLKEAFEALTPGRRRAYILHFSGAKQSKTRRSRIEKCVPKIMDGKGLRD